MIIFFVIVGYGGMIFVAIALFFIWGTMWPKTVERLAVLQRDSEARGSASHPKLKIMTWNVQFFAGREPVFFYDEPSGKAPRAKANREHLAINLKAAAKIIEQQNPDVIFLQEVDDGAKRTYGENQAENLLTLLPPAEWPWVVEAFYWKALFVPHPKIFGSVGTKLVTISKLPLERIAHRRALPEIPASWLRSRFQLKRAMLEARVADGPWKGLMLINTHLDAFAQGSDTMDKQVAVVHARLEELDGQGVPWVIGGDFNLLVPGARELLSEEHRVAYREDRTELAPLLDSFPVFPVARQVLQEDSFTHWPKDRRVPVPDRCIDYFFHSKSLQLNSGRVLQKEAWEVSDHFPLVAEWGPRSTG